MHFSAVKIFRFKLKTIWTLFLNPDSDFLHLHNTILKYQNTLVTPLIEVRSCISIWLKYLNKKSANTNKLTRLWPHSWYAGVVIQERTIYTTVKLIVTYYHSLRLFCVSFSFCQSRVCSGLCVLPAGIDFLSPYLSQWWAALCTAGKKCKVNKFKDFYTKGFYMKSYITLFLGLYRV